MFDKEVVFTWVVNTQTVQIGSVLCAVFFAFVIGSKVNQFYKGFVARSAIIKLNREEAKREYEERQEEERDKRRAKESVVKQERKRLQNIFAIGKEFNYLGKRMRVVAHRGYREGFYNTTPTVINAEYMIDTGIETAYFTAEELRSIAKDLGIDQ